MRFKMTDKPANRYALETIGASVQRRHARTYRSAPHRTYTPQHSKDGVDLRAISVRF